jgi:peptidoglycan pentaglycine glycine transferase (the first glycine)
MEKIDNLMTARRARREPPPHEPRRQTASSPLPSPPLEERGETSNASEVHAAASTAQSGEATSDKVVSPLPCAEDRWKAWDLFVEAAPDSGFMQTSWWVEFRNYCGFENFGITLRDGNLIVGGAVVLKYLYSDDSCFYYIQDGPVLPEDPLAAEQVFRAVFEEIETRRKTEPQVVSHLRMEPRWVRLPDFAPVCREIRPLADPYLETRDTRWIDLRPAEADILAQMKPKGRYNLGVARRHGVSVIEDTSEQGLRDFLAIYEETATRQGLDAKPPDYFEQLVASFSPGHRGALFFAEYQGRRIATALVVYFGKRATYFFGGSRAVDRQVMAPYLLHFEVMRAAKALGHEWYDLWGIAPANEPDHPWQNFSVFKAKFGGIEVHLVPTLDYVYDQAAYDGYIAQQRESGESESPDALTPAGTLNAKGSE